jgi:esterase/lipase
MKKEKVTIYNGKEKIIGILEKPSKSSDKIVIFAHGFTGSKEGPHSGLFPLTVERLLKYGFATLRIDFRGTGESDGYFEKMTVRGEANDLEKTMEFVKNLDYKRIGIVGESMGATASILAFNKKINCLVLWYPAVWLNQSSVYDAVKMGISMLDKEEWDLTYVKKRTGKKFKLGREFVKEVMSLNLENRLNEIDCPILFIHGNKDDAVPHMQSEKAIKLVSSHIKELETLDGGDHTFTINEENKIKCANLTANWFKRYL